MTYLVRIQLNRELYQVLALYINCSSLSHFLPFSFSNQQDLTRLNIHPHKQKQIITTMADFLKNLTGGDKPEGSNNEAPASGENKEEGGFLSGIGNKINSAAGGGKESEKNEDYLDKGAWTLPSNTRYH